MTTAVRTEIALATDVTLADGTVLPAGSIGTVVSYHSESTRVRFALPGAVGAFSSSTEISVGRDDTRHVVRTGSSALLIYPAGDADTVEVLSIDRDVATVRLPDGSTYTTVVEDLGVGVDDELVVEYDPTPDGPRCYVATPADQYVRGLITDRELESARAAVVHVGCATVRTLVTAERNAR